ncbi:hypothetical protein OQA88_9539 [Cercophora sp. LCS_1]
MVSLEQAQSSNARIASDLPAGLVAVFLGGTAGIGKLALTAFAKKTVKPRIYFLGRSKEKGDRIAAELKELNPDGEYSFINSDVSLLHNVDDVCREIKSREKHINLLFLTTGTLQSGKKTEEGLDLMVTVTHYSRIRFVVNLLPLVRRAPALRRVVSVLCGTKEGEMNINDFPGKNIGLTQMRAHYGSMMTFALESLALEAPDVSFVHNYPGPVKSDLGKDNNSAAIKPLMWAFKILGPLVWMSDADAAEWHLFLSTSAMFPPKLVVENTAGVPVGEGVTVVVGSNGEKGSGAYSVTYNGEPPSQKVLDLLARQRAQDAVRKLWFHIEEDVFRRVTGTTFI